MLRLADDYGRIETELAEEDVRVGDWPSPQWWEAHAALTGTVTDESGVTHAIPPGTVIYCHDEDTGEDKPFATINAWPGSDDTPILRDRYGDTVDIGEPWEHETVVLVALLAVIAAALAAAAWVVFGGGG